jgi:hypothetical protein
VSSTPTVSSTETTGPGNAATVAGIHAAFGRGDIPAILAALADDVRWEELGGRHRAAGRGRAPHAAARTGRRGPSRPRPELAKGGWDGSFYGGGRGSLFSGGWPSG